MPGKAVPMLSRSDKGSHCTHQGAEGCARGGNAHGHDATQAGSGGQRALQGGPVQVDRPLLLLGCLGLRGLRRGLHMGHTALAGSACWQSLTWELDPAPLVVVEVDASQHTSGVECLVQNSTACSLTHGQLPAKAARPLPTRQFLMHQIEAVLEAHAKPTGMGCCLAATASVQARHSAHVRAISQEARSLASRSGAPGCAAVLVLPCCAQQLQLSHERGCPPCCLSAPVALQQQLRDVNEGPLTARWVGSALFPSPVTCQLAEQ